jgi:hypothetical protein
MNFITSHFCNAFTSQGIKQLQAQKDKIGYWYGLQGIEILF